ncbi:hypothetical protein [Vulgatibacter sp.]|uniref:hypothetical protein n=1 Tax=Vulgatibacter sp. TaxID=1971226 RepID=UPI0035698C16
MLKKLLTTVSAGALLMAPTVALAADAQEAYGAIQTASGRVQTMLNAAKSQNDAIKFSCLNDKATMLKQLQGAADAQLARGTSTAATELQRMASEAQRLQNEAGNCVGADGKKAAEDVEESAQGDESGKTGDEKLAAERGDATDPGTTTGAIGNAVPGQGNGNGNGDGPPTATPPGNPDVELPAPASPRD